MRLTAWRREAYNAPMDHALREKIHTLRDGDMCSGPILGKLIVYTLPIMLSGILQLFYNAADVVVVGRYAGYTALAAVGSTGSLINLFVNLFLGLSVGVSVAVAQYYGAQDYDAIFQTVHTAICTAAIVGVVVGVAGVFAARTVLEWMACPPDVLDQASLYLRIYFFGVPGTMLYNFGAGVLRALGDTRRPLLFLTLSGLCNVILNLLFVIRFGMSVDGVAYATVISQYISAVLMLLCLTNAHGPQHLDWTRLRIYKERLWFIVRIGLPAGLQSAFFSISNILIQSSVNSFGSVAMAGNAAANNIEGFVYTSMNAVTQAATTFTGQNYGAKKYDRLGRICLLSLAFTSVVGLVMGNGFYLLGPKLLHFYNPDPAVIAYGMLRLSVVCTTHFLCGIMEILVSSMRGMGRSMLPMLVTVGGACGLRILWVYTVFAQYRTLPTLYLSYPISWIVTASAHLVCLLLIRRKLFSNETLMENRLIS